MSRDKNCAAVLESVFLLGRKSSPISPSEHSVVCRLWTRAVLLLGRISLSVEISLRGKNLGCWVLWNKNNAQQVNSFASGVGCIVPGWEMCEKWLVASSFSPLFEGKFIILLLSCMLCWKRRIQRGYVTHVEVTPNEKKTQDKFVSFRIHPGH